VHSGESQLDPAIAGKVMEEFRRMSQPQPSAPVKPRAVPPEVEAIEQLTDRETEILALVAQGKGNKDIAAELYLSEGTVRNYVSSIMAKLHANDRTQVVIKAAQRKMVKLD
jgi:DNA-binding NarL/FixJ family response regulator